MLALCCPGPARRYDGRLLRSLHPALTRARKTFAMHGTCTHNFEARAAKYTSKKGFALVPSP